MEIATLTVIAEPIVFKISLFDRVCSWLDRLDPSDFQTVIIGILTILIAVGAGILIFFLQERARGRVSAHLDLLVLLDEIFESKKLVVFSILSLFFMAIANLHPIIFLFGIIFFFFLIAWFFIGDPGNWIKKKESRTFKGPLFKIWEWFFEDPEKFTINFLKNLSISKKTTLVKAHKALWTGEAWNHQLGVFEKSSQKEVFDQKVFEIHEETSATHPTSRNESIKQLIHEREFIKIFIQHVDECIEHEEFSLAATLIEIFLHNLSKRDFWNFTMQNLFAEKTIDWALRAIEIDHEESQKPLEDRHQLWELLQSTADLQQRTFLRLLEIGQDHRFFLHLRIKTGVLEKKWNEKEAEILARLNKVIEEEKKKKKDGKFLPASRAKFSKILKETNSIPERQILEQFFSNDDSSILSAIFRKVPNFPFHQKSNFWQHTFPDDWKSSLKTMTEDVSSSPSPHKIADIFFSRFIDWAESRIRIVNDDWMDKQLEDVNRNLFSDADPILFADILRLFLFRSVEEALERPRTFGFIGRSGPIMTGKLTDKEIDRKVNKKIKEDEQQTVKFALQTPGIRAFLLSEEFKEICQELRSAKFAKQFAGGDEEKKRRLKDLKRTALFFETGVKAEKKRLKESSASIPKPKKSPDSKPSDSSLSGPDDPPQLF